MSPRRSSRLSRSKKGKVEEDANNEAKELTQENDPNAFLNSAAEDEEEEEEETYHFEGVEYKSYQDMVKAKRQRNQDILEKSGLLKAAESVKEAKKKASSRGLQKRKLAPKLAEHLVKRRKSNRLAGVESDGKYVDDERAGRFTIAGSKEGSIAPNVGAKAAADEDEHYRRRINDGAPLSVEQMVKETGPKWCQEDSVEKAQHLVRDNLQKLIITENNDNDDDSKAQTKITRKGKETTKKSSPTSVATSVLGGGSSSFTKAMVDALSVDGDSDDGEYECVAKVCPERIYSMAVHPSRHQLVVCAGDKKGHVGLWNVDQSNDNDDNNDGVHLFRLHHGATSCLQWTQNGQALVSTSYDGTVRWFDVESETADEIFATYNDDDKNFKDKLGFGLDTGSHFWTQYGCLDHRFSGEQCMFLSTSVGTAMHVDLRTSQKEGRITFHEELSEKKINTLSLHPNGYSLISAGLDCTVSLWDVRKLGDSRRRSSASRQKSPEPIAYYNGGRSVNSAFFSPSGQYIVSTTMANKLDLFENMHLSASSSSSPRTKKKQAASAIVQPYKSIRHDNMTGRWLTTFQAVFHPHLENMFCVGSMRKPRAVELFDAASGDLLRAVSGEALTAVASRLCFHPRSDKLILAGGNSSGRVTIIR